MDLSRKIIRLFLHHPMPPKAREMFRRWCLEEKDAEQKEALLHEEWNRLDPAEVLDIEKQNYGQKLRRLHAEMGLAPARRTFRARLLRMWPAAAAILVAGIVIADLYVVRHLAASRTTTTFVTAENCKGRITLPDNTVVWLNSESRLTYSKEFSRKGQRHVRLDGEAFFNVRKDSLRPFRVHMNDLQIEVLGTSFLVDATKAESSSVYVKTGIVSVESENSKVIIKANQKAELDNNTLKTGKIENPYEVFEEKPKVLTFENAGIMEVVEKFTNKWYNLVQLRATN